MADQRRDVVRQHDPALTCRPREHGGIISARQTYVLDTNDIELREAPAETANDVGIEIFVRCKA